MCNLAYHTWCYKQALVRPIHLAAMPPQHPGPPLVADSRQAEAEEPSIVFMHPGEELSLARASTVV